MRDTGSVTTLEEAREELEKWKRKASKHAAAESRARSFVAHYLRQIDQLSLPPEPAEGRVVSFLKSYRGNPIVYRFAAVRGGDRWWVTGDAPIVKHGVTWAKLIEFVRSGNTLLPQDPRPMVDEAETNPPF